MLARILLITLAVTFSLSVFSQDELGIPKLKHSNFYWSIGYLGSPTVTFEKYLGYSGTIQIGYNENNKNNEFLINISTGRIDKSLDIYFRHIEVSIGPRIFLNKSKSLFIEANAGTQIYSKIFGYYDYDFDSYNFHSSTFPSFYLAGGVGWRSKITFSSQLIYVLKFHSSMSSENGLTYISAQLGLSFNTIDTGNSLKQKSHNLSLTVLAGVNNPFVVEYKHSGWGSSLGIESAFKTGGKTEIFLNAMYNRFNLPYTQYSYIDNIELSIGPRFYFNQSSFTAFIEGGGGLYFIIKDKNSPFDPIQPGVSIGTGILNKFNNFFGVILKSKLNLLFTENPEFQNYFTLQGGVRLNL